MSEVRKSCETPWAVRGTPNQGYGALSHALPKQPIRHLNPSQHCYFCSRDPTGGSAAKSEWSPSSHTSQQTSVSDARRNSSYSGSRPPLDSCVYLSSILTWALLPFASARLLSTQNGQSHMRGHLPPLHTQSLSSLPPTAHASVYVASSSCCSSFRAWSA